MVWSPMSQSKSLMLNAHRSAICSWRYSPSRTPELVVQVRPVCVPTLGCDFSQRQVRPKDIAGCRGDSAGPFEGHRWNTFRCKASLTRSRMQTQCGVEIGHLRPWGGQEKIARVLQQHRGVENSRHVFEGETVANAWWIGVSAVLMQAVIKERTVCLQKTKVHSRNFLGGIDALLFALAGIYNFRVGAVRAPNPRDAFTRTVLGKEQSRRAEIKTRQLAPRPFERLQRWGRAFGGIHDTPLLVQINSGHQNIRDVFLKRVDRGLAAKRFEHSYWKAVRHTNLRSALVCSVARTSVGSSRSGAASSRPRAIPTHLGMMIALPYQLYDLGETKNLLSEIYKSVHAGPRLPEFRPATAASSNSPAGRSPLIRTADEGI